MAYVLNEIVPWIAGALLAGFLLGLVFWWARLWLTRRRETAEHLRGLTSYEVEGSGETLTAQIDQLQAQNRRLESRVAALAAAEEAAASARVRMKDLEDANTGLRDRVLELEAAGSDGPRPDSAADDDGGISGDGTPDADAVVEANAALDAANAELTERSEEVEQMRKRIRELETRNSVLVGQLEAGVSPQGFLADAGAATDDTADTSSAIDDPDAARSVLGFVPVADDLKTVEGIGPKISELCHGIGIETWKGLAATDPEVLRQMLDDAGSRFRVHDPSTWPEQARLLAANRWQEFKDLTDSLSGGK